MTKIVLVVLFFSKVSGLSAQNAETDFRKNQLTVSTGWSKHNIQDEVISPLIYRGGTLPIVLGYEHFGHLFLHKVSVFYGSLRLNSEINEEYNYFSPYSDNINVSLSYGILRKIYSLKQLKTELLIGAKFKSYLIYRNHHYTRDNATPIGDQTTSVDFNLRIAKKYNSQDIISFSFNVPVVAYVLTSGLYNVSVNPQSENLDPDKSLIGQMIKRGDFVFLNKLMEFQSEWSISKSVSKNLAIGVTNFLHYYSFERHPDQSATKYFNSQFLINASLKF